MESKFLTDQEIRRFRNQIQLPEIGLGGQEKFKNANVAVVGAGGLGSSVLKYLSAIGVGRIGIIDFSMVDESNVQLQTIYGGNDLGKLKTIITKQHLQELYPLVEYTIINLQLETENASHILRPFDIVVDATNTDSSSLIIYKTCIQLKIPVIKGAVSGFKGIAATFINNDKFTFQDLQIEKANYFEEEFGEIKPGGIALTYGLIGNILALEVVKFLVDSSKSLIGKILMIDSLLYSVTIRDF
jgi:molybdopterin/thiamine biosynthesis adenylyltransferase